MDGKYYRMDDKYYMYVGSRVGRFGREEVGKQHKQRQEGSRAKALNREG